MKNLKIAILGDHEEEPGGIHYEDARILSRHLINSGSQVIAAGSDGIARAVFLGAAEALKVNSLPLGGPYIQVYTDIGYSRHYPLGIGNEDSYCHNLRRIHHFPDVWVFFPGKQGTSLQLETIIHEICKGNISMYFKRLLIIGDDNPLIDRGLELCALVDQPVPWIIISKISQVYLQAISLAKQAFDLMLKEAQKEEKDQDGRLLTSEDLFFRLVASRHPEMSHQLAERTVRALAENELLSFAKARAVG